MSANFIENEKILETINSKSHLEEPEKIETIEDEKETETPISSEEKHENAGKTETNEDLDKNSDKDENTEKPEWEDLLGSGVILKKIIREGKHDTRPQRNEKCIINYSLYLEDETLVENVTNFELNLGELDVIQGLDIALGLMNVEEKCRLKIEPRLAFSKKGYPPLIPGDALVIYDVELIRVEPEDDIDLMSINQRRKKGNKKRERGNWWYTRGDNTIAIQCYRRALDYLDEVEGGRIVLKEDDEKAEVSDSDLQSILEDRISVSNNMAAAQIKMENYTAALNSLQIVLACQPSNVKAHFRKAKAYIGKNDLPTAMKCLMKAKELAPSDPEIQKEISRVSKMIDKQKSSERELARRMFNRSAKSDDEKNKRKPNGSKLALWATLGAIVAVGAAGFITYRWKI